MTDKPFLKQLVESQTSNNYRLEIEQTKHVRWPEVNEATAILSHVAITVHGVESPQNSVNATPEQSVEPIQPPDTGANNPLFAAEVRERVIAAIEGNLDG